jgi:hypothetical protein
LEVPDGTDIDLTTGAAPDDGLADPAGGEDDVLSMFDFSDDELRALHLLASAGVEDAPVRREQLIEALGTGQRVGNVMSALGRRMRSRGFRPLWWKNPDGSWQMTSGGSVNLLAGWLDEEIMDRGALATELLGSTWDQAQDRDKEA